MQDELIQQAYEDMDALYDFYVKPSISKMANDLEIDVDTLIRVFAGKETISLDLAKKLTYLRAIKLGTSYVPRPKPKLDTYNDIIEFGSVYVPAPKPKIDIFKDVIEFGTAYVKGPQSKLDIYNDIIEFGTCYIPAPKPELEPVDTSLVDEAQSRLEDLLRNIPVEELARKLKTSPLQIKNYFENKEPISLEIAKKLRFLWIMEFDTSYYQGPRSIIDEQLESSVFDSVYKFVGKNEKDYKISNIKDVLTHKIEDIDYDGALKRVIPDINKIFHIFFKKSLKGELSRELSSGTTTVVPKFRTFEIEILEDGIMQYYFIYGKGMIIDSSESLHYEKIVAVLKNDGSWEN